MGINGFDRDFLQFTLGIWRTSHQCVPADLADYHIDFVLFDSRHRQPAWRRNPGDAPQSRCTTANDEAVENFNPGWFDVRPLALSGHAFWPIADIHRSVIETKFKRHGPKTRQDSSEGRPGQCQ